MEEGERAVQLASLGVENVVLPGAEAAVQSGQAALQAGSAFVSVTADTGEHVAALAGEGGAATVAVGQEALTTAAQIGLAAVTTSVDAGQGAVEFTAQVGANVAVASTDAVLRAKTLAKEGAAMIGQGIDAVNFEFPDYLTVPTVDFSPLQNGANAAGAAGLQVLGEMSRVARVSGAVTAVAAIGGGCQRCIENLPFDITKLEIARDFYQVLGILVECIAFPVAFERFFGEIAKFLALALDDMLRWVIIKGPSAVTWWWIIAAPALLGAMAMFYFAEQDVPRKSTKKKRVGPKDGSTPEFDWRKHNQIDQGRRYRIVKYLLFFMTSIYAPASRNAFQVIMCADKYAYAQMECVTISNKTGKVTEAAPIDGYLFKGQVACPEARYFLDNKHPAKGSLIMGEVIKTAHERLTIIRAPAFQTPGFVSKEYGGSCFGTGSHLGHIAASVLVLAVITILFPMRLKSVVTRLRPQPIYPGSSDHPYAREPTNFADPNYREKVELYLKMHDKPVWYDDEGHIEEFTADVYRQEVQRHSDNPYVYLYEVYEQEWAMYKVYVMWFKFAQIIPAVVLTSSLFQGRLSETVTTILQASLACVILSVYMFFAWKAAPFMDHVNDMLDRSCRVVLLLCPATTLIAHMLNPKGMGWGLFLNIVVGLHLGVMVIVSSFTGSSGELRLKKLLGRIDFYSGSTRHRGKVGTLPTWNLPFERRRRLWKPFWNHIFQSDIKLTDATIEREDEDGKPLKTPKVERLPTVKPFSDAPPLPRPKERLEESFTKLHAYGFEAWEKGLLALDKEEAKQRFDVQLLVEGLDVYCDDKWTTGYVSSIISEEHRNMTRSSNWARVVIDPFPFSVDIYWENSPIEGSLRSWGETSSRIKELLEKNLNDEEIVRQRQVRTALRALAADQTLLLLPQRGNDGTQYTYGTIVLRTRRREDYKRKEDWEIVKHWEEDFVVTMVYSDGVGSNGKQGADAAFAGASLGLDAQYSFTPQLQKLLGWLSGGNENTAKVSAAVKKYSATIAAKRNETLKKRLMDQWCLSWGFWYFVYNNDCMRREEVDSYLRGKGERNPLVRQICERQKGALDFLYSMMDFYNANPVFATWYNFWFDVWSHNQDLPSVKNAMAILDTTKPEALCYKPLGAKALRKLLSKHGNPLGKKQETYILALFARMKEVLASAADANTVQHRTSPNAVTEISYILQSDEVDTLLSEHVLSKRYDEGANDAELPCMPTFDIVELMDQNIQRVKKKAEKHHLDALKRQQEQARASKIYREGQEELRRIQMETQMLKQQELAAKMEAEKAANYQRHLKEVQRQQELYRKQQEQQQEYLRQEQQRQQAAYQQQQQWQQQMQQQQQQQQQQRMMTVTVPPNCVPGQQIQVNTPHGSFPVTIPQGVQPGGMFHIQL